MCPTAHPSQISGAQPICPQIDPTRPNMTLKDSGRAPLSRGKFIDGFPMASPKRIQSSNNYFIDPLVRYGRLPHASILERNAASPNHQLITVEIICPRTITLSASAAQLKIPLLCNNFGGSLAFLSLPLSLFGGGAGGTDDNIGIRSYSYSIASTDEIVFLSAVEGLTRSQTAVQNGAFDGVDVAAAAAFFQRLCLCAHGELFRELYVSGYVSMCRCLEEVG